MLFSLLNSCHNINVDSMELFSLLSLYPSHTMNVLVLLMLHLLK